MGEEEDEQKTMAPFQRRRWFQSSRYGHRNYDDEDDSYSSRHHGPNGHHFHRRGGRDLNGRLTRLEAAMRLVESVRHDCACTRDRETVRENNDASTQVEAEQSVSESSSVQQETMNYLVAIRKQVNELKNALADLKGELRQRTRHLKKEFRALEKSDSESPQLPEIPARPYRCFNCAGLGHKARDCLRLKIVKEPLEEETEQPEKSDAPSQ